MSSPPLWAPLKRSSALRIPRPGRSPYSAAAAAGSGGGTAAAAGCAGVKGSASSHSPERDIVGFLKTVTGIAACGSGLGLWLASSNSSPSSSPLSSPPDPSSLAFHARDTRSDLEEDVPLVPDAAPETKPRYLFGDAYRRRVFFNYEKRMRMLSPPEKENSLLSPRSQ